MLNAYVIVRCATKSARLALNALPPVLFHRENHVGGELEAGGMRRATAIRAGDQIFC